MHKARLALWLLASCLIAAPGCSSDGLPDVASDHPTADTGPAPTAETTGGDAAGTLSLYPDRKDPRAPTKAGH